MPPFKLVEDPVHCCLIWTSVPKCLFDTWCYIFSFLCDNDNEILCVVLCFDSSI